MKHWRVGWRTFWLALWVVNGLLVLGLVFPLSPLSVRLALKRQWSRVLLHLCGVRLKVSGEPAEQGAALWVMNHVSWLDIFVTNYVRSTTFVAKQEIRHWPVLGWLVAGADTIFVQRGYRQAVHRVGLDMESRFLRGQTVGLFPEATTSDGFDVLPFYANLFEPAKRSGAPVQPVALRYYHRGVRSDYVAFVGEQTFMDNLWRVLGTTGVTIELLFLDAMDADETTTRNRHEIALWARETIQDALRESCSDSARE